MSRPRPTKTSRQRSVAPPQVATDSTAAPQPAPAQQVLLRLQHDVGNQATNEVLQRVPGLNEELLIRHSVSALIQRQGSRGVVKSPHASKGSSGKGEVAEPLEKDVRAALIDDRDTFVNLWLTAALAALEGAPQPKEPESAFSWFVGLAGNLLWAASTLLAPEAVLMIRLMSFAGAAVGSGLLMRFAGEAEKAPSGRETVSQMLTKSRDLMVKASGPLDRAVTDCVAGHITDPEEQRKVLWRMLFKTPFNESEPIRAEMSAKINAALNEFLIQWHASNDAITKEAEAKGFTGGFGPEVWAMPDVVAEYSKDSTRAWMLVQDPWSRVGALRQSLVKTKPFTPHLSFE